MTKSEQICNEIGAKFFCKDYVYENLKYFNKNNNKVELCDALFEYSSIYVPLQIKERAKNKGTKSDDVWMRGIVYGEAVEQVIATIDGIKNNRIVVNDSYHQPVTLNKRNLIFPIIVFDNSAVVNYKRVIVVDDIKINVFSLDDYQSMMCAIIHPYDIIYYLQERVSWINENGLPNLIIGENESSTLISNIASEKEFAIFFKLYIYGTDERKQKDALRHLALIGTFRERQVKKCSQYKKILSILQLIEPKIASEFMSRFDYAWQCACDNKFDFSKSIQVVCDNKKTSIVFFSIGRKELKSKEYYQVLCDAKQLQQKADAVLLITFVGDEANCCNNDWVYFEKECDYDAEALKFYENIGMFRGEVDLDIYEFLCSKLLNENP